VVEAKSDFCKQAVASAIYTKSDNHWTERAFNPNFCIRLGLLGFLKSVPESSSAVLTPTLGKVTTHWEEETSTPLKRHKDLTFVIQSSIFFLNNLWRPVHPSLHTLRLLSVSSFHI
jgi:hypothetical protein